MQTLVADGPHHAQMLQYMSSLGLAADSQEKTRLEEQIRQSQKMEAVGRLAGGVAHDFNNLLTIINGCSEILLAEMSPDDPNRDLVQDIQTAGDRAASLTRQLLAFSRKQLLVPVVLNLNAQLDDMSGLLQRLVGVDVDLRMRTEPNLWNVECDPGQVQQVIMNLAINARDAMPRGGRLTVLTGNACLDECFCEEHPEVRPGEYVLLAISDTGHGMDDATRARIFEPFFTTKENGRGTGLGLATVYGIVRQSGGAIEVTSEPGRGTTFGIYLPRSTRSSSVPATAVPAAAAERRGSETILLVEDEGGVRSLARTVLEGQGYTVLAAADGFEALDHSRRHDRPIHLLVSDVIMPGMSGPELAERLGDSRRGMRVLFMSGYTGEALNQHGIDDENLPFLPKPFTPTSLARKVRELLEDAPVV